MSFPWSMIDKITPPLRAGAGGAGAPGCGGHGHCPHQHGHPYRPLSTRRSRSTWCWRTLSPTDAPPWKGRGVSHGPDHRGEGGKDEGGHLPQPLHTALAVYGCLLGYTSIAAEMGMQISRPWWSILPPRVCPWWKIPVSSAPGHSLTRCSMSDSPIPPSRIHRSVSQPTPHRSCPSVTAAPSGAMHGSRSRHWPDWSSPLVFAGWCRYLLGVDDRGNAMPVSPDPMLPQLQAHLKGIEVGRPDSLAGQLRPILSNAAPLGLICMQQAWGEDRRDVPGHAGRPGAVRATLHRNCACKQP